MKDVGDRIEMKAVPVLSPIIETLFLISVFAGLSPSWQRTIRCSSTTTLSTLATEGTSRRGQTGQSIAVDRLDGTSTTQRPSL
jgi:hypothetical protein